MLKKNSYFTGVLAALIFPAVACGVASLLQTSIWIINRPALPYFVAIAFNLVMIRIALRHELDKTGRGIMFATFAVMLLIFLFKVHLR